MKSSAASPNLEPLRFNKKDRHISKENLCLFFLWLLGVTTIVSLYFLYSPTPFKFPSKQVFNGGKSIITKIEHDYRDCDIFDGRWIPELNGPLYTNRSCSTIPESNNCGKHGRKDVDYMNWRWKPYGCKLPRFDAKIFLSIVRGKTLAFIGDSVARNQMESLLCLLSQEQTPIDIYKDPNNRFRTWYFSSHDFTIKVLWAKFFVITEERVINGTWKGVYNMHLDKIDNKWARELPGVDYAIISNGHWYFRPIYLYENGNVVACVYCDAKNISKVSPGYALRRSFQMALTHINSCKGCNGLVTLLRTFSPAHFEGGTWNGGGKCNKTSPYNENQIDFGSTEWELSRIQIEEVERVKRESGNTNMRFEVLDVTKAALMRPDGHPDIHWDNQWMKGYSDCVHWCLPGPIDVWNDLLMAVIRKVHAD